jgi:hypothetical protein
MVILIVSLLLLVILAVVLYPVLSRRDDSSAGGDATEDLVEGLRRDRDRVYEEMRVLEQEYFLHHLSAEAYREQLQTARLQAALLLRQQQRYESEHELDRKLSQAPTARPDVPDQDSHKPDAPPCAD